MGMMRMSTTQLRIYLFGKGSILSQIIQTYPHIVQNIHGNCLGLIKNKTNPKGCDAISITAIIAEVCHDRKKKGTTRHYNEIMTHYIFQNI